MTKIGSLRAISRKEFHVSNLSGKAALDTGNWGQGQVTSHIFLSLEHNECIATMLLLLLIRFFMLMGIYDNSYLQYISKSK